MRQHALRPSRARRGAGALERCAHGGRVSSAILAWTAPPPTWSNAGLAAARPVAGEERLVLPIRAPTGVHPSGLNSATLLRSERSGRSPRRGAGPADGATPPPLRGPGPPLVRVSCCWPGSVLQSLRAEPASESVSQAGSDEAACRSMARPGRAGLFLLLVCPSTVRDCAAGARGPGH